MKLKDDLVLLEETTKKKEVSKELVEEIYTKILFYQHERFIHLVVTFFVGISCILFLLGFLQFELLPLLILFLLTLCLLIPYIFYYYTLENGVQKLYDYYFQIREKSSK